MIKRTHCIAPTQVDYVQPYTVSAEIHGRPLDVIGGALVALIGLGGISSENRRYNDDFAAYQVGLITTEPNQPTGGYVVAGAVAAAGLAWIGWSRSSHRVTRVHRSSPRSADGPSRRSSRRPVVGWCPATGLHL